MHANPILHGLRYHRLLIRLHCLSRRLLDEIARIRPPSSTHLVLGHGIFDLLDIDELLYPHDLTSDGLCDGVVDGCHAFAEAERLQDTLGLQGHADSGAHERYPEVGHCVDMCREVCLGVFARFGDAVLLVRLLGVVKGVARQ
jgi:hypothetical protein